MSILSSGQILFVADFFHPVGRLAVKLLDNGNVRHGRCWRSTAPVLLSRRKPDHVTRPDFFDWTTPALHPAAPGRHNQGLAQRVGVPCRSSAGLEGDTGAENPRRRGRVEERVNSHRAGEILFWSFD